MTKNKPKAVWIITTVISLFAVVLGTYYSARNKEQATESSAAANASLYLEPVNSNIDINTVLVPTLKINPTTNQVTAIEVYLTFDKTKLAMESITPTSTYITLKAPLIDNNAGTASFIVGIKGGIGITPVPITSVSDIASIRVKSKTVYGDALISVTTASKAAAKGLDTSVLGTYGQMVVHIVNPTVTYPNWDVNQDTYINVLDIGLISDNYDSTSPTTARADVNRDGVINIVDIGIVVDHYQ